MERRRALLLVLLLALLAATGLLFASVAEPPGVRAAGHAVCQPVTGAALAGLPAPVYPNTPVLLGAEILTGSLPVTYTWTFGDGSPPVGGVALSPTFYRRATATRPPASTP